MNADTERDTKSILKSGWYQKGQTLGEGGWEYLHREIENWKRYIIHIGDGFDEPDEVIARDDEAAIAAFREIYLLDEYPYEILEKVTTYRLVSDNIYEKES